MTLSMPERTQQAILRMIPVGRRGSPDELARAVAFLLADDAGYITGSAPTVDGDPEVRAVVLTGDGDFFSAGTDLSRGSGGFDSDATSFKPLRGGTRDVGGELSLRIFASTRPVIAAVNGTAVGIGITMILPMDIRIAADSARFALPFAKRGIVPESCATWFLPRVVGIATAVDWPSPQGLSAPTKHSPPGSSASCFPPKTCSPGPWRSRMASPATPQPCRSP